MDSSVCGKNLSQDCKHLVIGTLRHIKPNAIGSIERQAERIAKRGGCPKTVWVFAIVRAYKVVSWIHLSSDGAPW